MKIITLLFNLGILFTAFAFLWFWIKFLLVFIVPETVRTRVRYFLQLLQSLFLGTLVLRFLKEEGHALNLNPYVIIAIITYFLYLIRNIHAQKRMVQIQVYSNLYSQLKTKNDWEWTVALISLALTLASLAYPASIDSMASAWFYQETQAIIDLPLLGTIFKIFGFFFILGLTMRVLWSIQQLTQAKKEPPREGFDDYEEV